MRINGFVFAVPMALLLTACGGDASADVSDVDRAGCDSAYQNGGPAAVGDEDAVRALLDDLGDAGPDDDYSDEVSGRLQILAADALLITSGAPAPNIADHVDDAFDACTDMGWEAPE